ncbi:hypothetical protein R1flu_004869 [Riccia fluitans]|uniref:Uncharacterized protein n=1 Tax=Riccia fluitans TaxID=41844 RepID=A0ABD1YRV6_9MARC
MDTDLATLAAQIARNSEESKKLHMLLQEKQSQKGAPNAERESIPTSSKPQEEFGGLMEVDPDPAPITREIPVIDKGKKLMGNEAASIQRKTRETHTH